MRVSCWRWRLIRNVGWSMVVMHDIGIDLEGCLGNYNIGRLLQRSHLFFFIFFFFVNLFELVPNG
jgi:hypothetical protein